VKEREKAHGMPAAGAQEKVQGRSAVVAREKAQETSEVDVQKINVGDGDGDGSSEKEEEEQHDDGDAKGGPEPEKDAELEEDAELSSELSLESEDDEPELRDVVKEKRKVEAKGDKKPGSSQAGFKLAHVIVDLAVKVSSFLKSAWLCM
jgi:hypothetical protein